jgi:hypothetical protein
LCRFTDLRGVFVGEGGIGMEKWLKGKERKGEKEKGKEIKENE